MNRNRKIVVVSAVGIIALGLTGGGIAKADFTFGERINLGPTVNSPQGEGIPIISPDGLELYFASNRPGGSGDWDIWMTKRASLEDPWGTPVNLGPGINSARDEYPTSVSSDGLTLYLFANAGTYDLYTATRPTTDAPWGPRVNMGPILNGPGVESAGAISSDDLELYFASNRPGGMGGYDIYVSTRASPAAPWGPPANLGPAINTSGTEFAAVPVSSDGLVLFIGTDDRPGGLGDYDMWIARRPSRDAAWSAPVNLGPSFNTPQGEALISVSSDGQWAYVSEFGLHGKADLDLWMAPIIPTVDFNGDGVVDIADVFILLEHWHTDYSLCDIGPMPWGDGFVDAQDLIVLAEHIANNPADVNDVNNIQ